MFRRRTETPTAPDATAAEAAGSSARSGPAPGATPGKGRPTPTRKEAEAARKAAVKPADRKAAARLDRERARAERAKAREAMLAGDERYLPKRDQGPVRAYARDWVDTRWSVGELFMPGAIVVLILGVLPFAALRNVSVLLWFLLTALVIADTIVLGFRLKKALARRFPDEVRKGAVAYGVLRALQLRALRIPKPRLKRGASVA